MPRSSISQGERVLDERSLNRALLSRQLLLDRRKLTVPAALERLVGLQAQSPQNPYVALWSRLSPFGPESLSRLIASRKAVRIALMRSTIHLVTDDDCLTLRPVMQPMLDRALKGTFGARLAGLDMAKLAAAGRALTEDEPMTLGAMGKLLEKKWPGRDPLALAQAVRAVVPLVQVPPRGLWRASGVAAHTSTDAWIRRPLETETVPDETVLRYLAAFGPATIKDAQVWSGLTRLDEAFTRLRPRLRTFRDPHGRTLFDVANGLTPDPSTPAPPRFLPEYDNVLLSHADRTRIVADARRIKLVSQNMSASWLLVDGFLAGSWKFTATPRLSTMSIQLMDKLSKESTGAVMEEAQKLAAFLAPDSSRREVKVV